MARILRRCDRRGKESRQGGSRCTGNGKEILMNCSVIVIIDQSYSMVKYKFLKPAQRDAGTFVGTMKTGDSVGVVAFDDTANIIFGKQPNPLTLITSKKIKQ